MLNPGPKWYDNPTHPIWGLALVAMTVWTAGVVFGGGGLARVLANRSNK